MKTASNIADLIKTIGIDWFATHLINMLDTLQRQFAIHNASMNGMMWPDNLIGKMQGAIKEQDPTEIAALTAQCKKWLEDSQAVQESLHNTLVLIETFVTFHNSNT